MQKFPFFRIPAKWQYNKSNDAAKNNSRYSVPFIFDFGSATPAVEPIIDIPLFAFDGAEYYFDPKTFQGVTEPFEIKTVSFSITFNNNINGPGAFVIYVPSSGQLIQITPEPSGDDTTPDEGYCVTGVVQIICNPGDQIVFAKQADTDGIVRGLFWCNVNNFEMAPYLYSGVTNYAAS